MGLSSSKNSSEQSAEVYLTQQFSGTCNVTCQNTMSSVSISMIDSTVGGNVEINQTCSTNASCLIGSTMDATSDVLFKATNSANAKNAWSGWSLDPFNFDSASNDSRQDIRQSINQSTTESCNISSYNQMNNISIFAANSTIGGDISISQNASTQGQCQLHNSMSAAAYATGQAQNTASSGKDKKGQKFGDKSGKLTILTYLVIAVVVIVIVSIVGKIIAGHSKKSAESKQEQEFIEARAMAGCPGGMKPILDPKTGKPVLDPKTKRPVCPPPPMYPPRSAPPVVVTPGGQRQYASAPPQFTGGPTRIQETVEAPVTVVLQDYGSRGGRGSRGGNGNGGPKPSASQAASVGGTPPVAGGAPVSAPGRLGVQVSRSGSDIPSLPQAGLVTV